jgi:MoxR-like ATPase
MGEKERARGRAETGGPAPSPRSVDEASGSAHLPRSVDEAVALLRSRGYVADESLGTALFLALELGRPLFLEGEAGTGKTELARSVAGALGKPLVRLQCYEGLDMAAAAYEWNFARQMIHIRAAELGRDGRAGDGASTPGSSLPAAERDVFGEEFLIRRPLLQALDPPDGVAPVLLIDELDRSDEPFEAYLLEVLADFQITIPELGTIRARKPPIVVITSNRTREIHDALKRRCIYHWIDYPTAEREMAILASRVPEAPAQLSGQVVGFVRKVREMELFKRPGVAETLDWARALMALNRQVLDRETVNRTLGVLLKYQDDLEQLRRDGGVEEAMAGAE